MTGLTTAATIWVVAAIGLAAGFGAIVEATGTAVFVLLALAPLRRIEERVHERRDGDRRQGDRRGGGGGGWPEAPPPNAG